MAEGVVLTGATALVTTAPPGATPAGRVSITVTAKALADIDILIAKCCADIVLADPPGSGQHSYEMVTRPIRLDTLSDPAVMVRAIGITARTDLVVAVWFEVDDRFKRCALVFHYDFGDICLTAESTVAMRRLPLSRFRSDQ